MKWGQGCGGCSGEQQGSQRKAEGPEGSMQDEIGKEVRWVTDGQVGLQTSVIEGLSIYATGEGKTF